MREGDVQVLETHVVEHLVEGALQERRVDGRHRLHALGGEPGREGHGVLLGNAHVVEALRERPSGSASSPVPSAMAAVIADDALVFARQLDQRVGEDILVLRRPGLRRG